MILNVKSILESSEVSPIHIGVTAEQLLYEKVSINDVKFYSDRLAFPDVITYYTSSAWKWPNCFILTRKVYSCTLIKVFSLGPSYTSIPPTFQNSQQGFLLWAAISCLVTLCLIAHDLKSHFQQQ